MGYLKIELKRAFNSVGMIAALVIGLGCVFYKNYMLSVPVIQMLRESEKYNWYTSFYKMSFYNNWMIGYLGEGMLYLFYFLGIIVALPYGGAYYRDRKSGLIKNICSRIDKRKYLISKYIAVFVAGGFASAMPITIDLMLSKLKTPHEIMRIQNTVLSGTTEWGVFIIDHLYLSAFIFIMLWFIFGGALATISLMVSSVADNIFTIQLMPFFIMLGLFYLPTFLPANYNKYFPFGFLTLFSAHSNPIIALTFSISMLIINFSVFMFSEKKRDII